MLLCSTVNANHWLSQLHKVKEGDEKGVCLINLQYLCSDCASLGETGMCVHGRLKVPFHIESSADGDEDPVRQMMELVQPGAYQTEVCGYNLHTAEKETLVFGQQSISVLASDKLVELTADDQERASAVHVAMDPVQAGSGTSGIGLATVLKIEETYVVSILSIRSLLALFPTAAL